MDTRPDALLLAILISTQTKNGKITVSINIPLGQTFSDKAKRHGYWIRQLYT